MSIWIMQWMIDTNFLFVFKKFKLFDYEVEIGRYAAQYT